MVPSSLHLTCKDVRLGENLYSNQADLDLTGSYVKDWLSVVAPTVPMM
jgi:hypothetical protein